MKNLFLLTLMILPAFPQPLPSEARQQERIRKYEQIVADNPRDVEFWHELALAYRDAEMWDKAINADSEAVKRLPRYAAAFHSRGKSRIGKQDYLGAIPDFTEAIRLFELRGGIDLYLTVEQPPDSYIDSYRTRGIALSHLDRFSEAITDVATALKLRKDDATLIFEKGYLEEKAGRKTDAVVDLHRAGLLYADNYGRKSAEDCAAHLDALGAHGEAAEVRRKLEPRKAKSDLP
jgi:tetratricopeptide (TPR) repeat protein